MNKTVELTDEQIDLMLRVFREKIEDLNVVLKNTDGLSDDTIHDLQLDHRDINSIMREIQFYAVMK